MKADDVVRRRYDSHLPINLTAQRWHDEHHGRQGPAWSDCWCCCLLCDPETGWEKANPNWPRDRYQPLSDTP